MTRIALFDLDGVLIYAAGYSAAVRASLAYLFRSLDPLLEPPGAEVQALFESMGVTSEWDMVAIALVMAMDAAGKSLGEHLPDLPLRDTLRWFEKQQIAGLAIPYEQYFTGLKQILRPGILPARILLDAIRAGAARPVFPRLNGQAFLADLLGSTRQPGASLPVLLVQNHVLGDAVFERTYRIPAAVQTGSLLRAFDRPALDPHLAARLVRAQQRGGLGMAAFTARPSLPPRGSTADARGYSPEAEMALELIGLPGLPLIGFGRLEWLAAARGGCADQYLKPSPVQPLAAIAAAAGLREDEALLWAHDLANGAGAGLPACIPSHFTLYAFEDSNIGLLGAAQAAQILRAQGCEIGLSLWGVATHPQKVQSLENAGAQMVADVNQAIEQAFGDLIRPD